MAHFGYLWPRRGRQNADGGIQALSDKPQTLFIQVDHGRNERDGQRLIEYYIPLEVTFSADTPLICTATGGVGGAAGANVALPAIPAGARILGILAENTALVSTNASGAAPATAADIDLVNLGSTAIYADGTLSASPTAAPLASLATLPVQLTAPQAITVYLAGSAGDRYVSGTIRLYVKVLSYFEA